MVVDTETLPWDMPDTAKDGGAGPKQSIPSSPKNPISPKFLPRSLGMFSKAEK